MKMSSKQRIVIFFGYIILSYFIYRIISEKWIFENDFYTIWFSSMVAYFIYYLFVAAFFVKPKDSLATAITTLIVFLSINIIENSSIHLVWWFGVVLSSIVIVTSVINIFILNDNPISKIGNFTYKLCQHLGNGEALFFLVLFYCSLSLIQKDFSLLMLKKFIILNLFWFIIIQTRPLEFIVLTVSNKDRKCEIVVGKIFRVDSPNIVRVQISSNCKWEQENYLALLNENHWIRILPTSKQYQSEKIVGTGYYFDCNPSSEINKNRVKQGEVVSISDIKSIEELTFQEKSGIMKFVGVVVENSTISSINIEIMSTIPIEEGYLLAVKIHEKIIYYQIIDGITNEEIFNNNPKGKVIATANQIGIFTEGMGFTRYSWTPEMNSPVFLVNSKVKQNELQNNDIGFIPNSDIPISVNYENLTQYHCAILGITGSGKTELAFDIIRRNLLRGVKVVCVDITGDYMYRLKDLSPLELNLEPGNIDKINKLIEEVETGKYGAKDEKKEFYKYLDKMSQGISDKIENFMKSNGNLAIIQLLEIANTRSTLRITEEFLSSIFNWAKSNKNSTGIQIVLEEAHTIIPENNYFKYDSVDSAAVVGRMAQIALQGRKYKVGLMIVSQRTALVSKTVLTQCNTFLTFNLIDKTSYNFLESLLGDKQIGCLRNLKDLQMVAHGKAVNSDNPVIVEIPYDSSKLKASKFRAKQ